MHFPKLPLQIFSLVLVLMLGGIAAGQSKDWRPITPAELQMMTPKVEADADAEALFWEVRVVDEYDKRTGYRTVLNHYLRIKVFTERGRDVYNKVEIGYGRASDLGVEISVKDIAARTIKPDGTILDVKESDIFEKDTVKGNGIKFKAKSFVMPGVEAGSIVEYRWKEIRGNSLNMYARLELSRDIPVHYVKYSVKPVSFLGMRLHSIETAGHFVKEKDGYYSTAMENVPSFKEEVYMPSGYQVRPWVLAYYEDDDEKDTAEEYWRKRGKQTYEVHKSWLEPSDEVKRMAAQVAGGETDEGEIARRLFDYCRKNIVNVGDDASGLTPDQLSRVKENKTASDVLSRGTGTWHDIQMLFGAMLASEGIDVRVANVSSQIEPIFDKSLGNRFFNRIEIIAAKIGDGWKFFDPSSRYIPFGSIPSSVEGQVALISDPNQPFFVNTPVAPPDRSTQKRTAQLQLADDGTIEGEVRIEYTGHLDSLYKGLNDDRSPTEREKALINMVKAATFDTAEVTAISIDNAKDTEKPFAYSFHIRLPSYAQRTGRRMFLQPNIFERSSKPLFVKGVRKYDVSFEHSWSEEDVISIALPTGYTAEAIEPPPYLTAHNGNALLETKYGLSADRSVLDYSRTFSFGNKSILKFDSNKYPGVKSAFDSFHQAGTKGIMLLKN